MSGTYTLAPAILKKKKNNKKSPNLIKAVVVRRGNRAGLLI